MIPPAGTLITNVVLSLFSGLDMLYIYIYISIYIYIYILGVLGEVDCGGDASRFVVSCLFAVLLKSFR